MLQTGTKWIPESTDLSLKQSQRVLNILQTLRNDGVVRLRSANMGRRWGHDVNLGIHRLDVATNVYTAKAERIRLLSLSFSHGNSFHAIAFWTINYTLMWFTSKGFGLNGLTSKNHIFITYFTCRTKLLVIFKHALHAIFQITEVATIRYSRKASLQAQSKTK